MQPLSDAWTLTVRCHLHGGRVLSALLDLRKAGTERTEVDWQQCLTKGCDLTVNVVVITAKSIGKQMGI